MFTAGKQVISLARKTGKPESRFRIYLCTCGCYHVTQMTIKQYNKSKLK